mmetsp:Transcript_37007/g.86423  ORF Transcript_37007/g.86423 Transcript_37007/m.86423 type:complete len:283 (-) Transcript_37007:224-1072(-)
MFSPSTRTIAAGVAMPYVNLGGVHSHPSNYTLWLEKGGRGLDTALMYGDDVQLSMGDAIKASGIPRDQLFVTSKVPCCPARFTSWCSWYDSEYAELDAYTRATIDLRLLSVDHVDLMLLHWPCDTLEDTVRTYRSLERFQLSGKARAIGISNFNASAIDALFAAGLKVTPTVNQCGFSIGNHRNPKLGSDYDTLMKCRAKNITYSAYSPLGGLSGIPVLSNPAVQTVAKRHGKSTAQVALRWVTQQGVVAVTASNNSRYDAEDLDILDFSLDDSEMDTLKMI